jgi:hypothetical protein
MKTKYKEKIKYFFDESKDAKHKRLKRILYLLPLFIFAIGFVYAFVNFVIPYTVQYNLKTIPILKKGFEYSLGYTITVQKLAPFSFISPQFSWIGDIIVVIVALFIGILFRNLDFTLLFTFMITSIGFFLGFVSLLTFIIIGFVSIFYFVWRFRLSFL